MSVQREATEQDLHNKAHEVLQSSSSSSSSLNPLSLKWGDLEGNFVSLQNSIETRLKELEIKETQVNDRLRELETREKEITRLRNALCFDSGPELGSIGGKKLLTLLGEPMSEHDKLCERVRRVLENSEDPGKLVLEAVGEVYGERVELGFSASGVGKRSCLVVLEQLARAAPKIGPTEKAEAARLAREWRAKIRVEGQNGLLEVLGFLLLLGAYDLVDEFDSGEMLGVFRSIGKHDKQVSCDLGVDTSWGSEFDNDSDLASTSPVSQEKTKLSLEDDLELVNQIASAFTNTFDALKFLCVAMDGKNLKLFLYQYMEEGDSWSTMVRDALCLAPDPAKLVLETMPGFLRNQPEFHKKLTPAKVRKIFILLMEQLMAISPPISQFVREEASKLADEWGSNLGSVKQRPVIVYVHLLFLAANQLGSKYETDELLRLLRIASKYKAFPGLSQALGLPDYAEVVRSLIEKNMLLEAVDNIYAYGLLDKFQAVQLLRDYLSCTKKRLYKKGDQSSSQQKCAIKEEIAEIKKVMQYVAKYKLESKYPPKELEKQILQLEEKKGQINDTAKSRKPKADKKKNVPANNKGKINDTAESAKPKVDQKENVTSETEIAAVRSVVEGVAKYKLESELPPEELERRIAVLEMLKARVNRLGKNTSSSLNVQALQ